MEDGEPEPVDEPVAVVEFFVFVAEEVRKDPVLLLVAVVLRVVAPLVLVMMPVTEALADAGEVKLDAPDRFRSLSTKGTIAALTELW